MPDSQPDRRLRCAFSSSAVKIVALDFVLRNTQGMYISESSVVP